MSGFTTLGKKGSGGGLTDGGTGGAGAIGPFGTTLVSNLTPSAQGTFVYDINNTQFTTGSNGVGASVTSTQGVAVVSSGNSLSGSARVFLTRGIKYRPGQGAVCRLTAIFDQGQSNTYQLAGVGNSECGFYFAKVGNDFGILHRERSSVEIRSFTITAPPAGAATVVVTLGGSSISVAINGGGSNDQTSYQISQADYSQVGSGWYAEAVDGTVYFLASRPGPMSGTFSMTVGGSPIATPAVVRSGVLPVETFISQSSWNVDTMDGNGPSRFVLDHTKGNVYNVGYQYLGFGNPTFSVEDSATGMLTTCHRIQIANSKTTTVMSNPHVQARWEAINSGSSTGVTVRGASAATFTEGLVMRSVGPSFTTTSYKASVGVTQVPALTVRANRMYKNQSCFGELDVFNISVGDDAGNAANTRLVIVNVYKNAVIGGPVNFQSVDPRSIASVDTSATTITTNSATQLLKTYVVPANSSIILNLAAENFFVANGESITIGLRTYSNTVDTVATSISWFEDQ